MGWLRKKGKERVEVLPYCSWDGEASENKIDVLFFRADVTNSIHMKVNAGWLCKQTNMH